jgi:hypothetical protein
VIDWHHSLQNWLEITPENNVYGKYYGDHLESSDYPVSLVFCKQTVPLISENFKNGRVVGILKSTIFVD